MSNAIALVSHMAYIYLMHQLLLSVIDWEKIIKNSIDNQRRIRLFILMLSIALGYLVSHFFLDVLSISNGLISGLIFN